MVNKINADQMCRDFGGEYDYDHSGSCKLPMPFDEKPRSVINQGMLGFFLIQIGIGVSTTVLGTYFGVTLLPVVWWSGYIIFAISFTISLATTWYKIGNWKEAAIRTVISSITIFALSVLLGTIFYWDLYLYIDIVTISGEPLSSAIIGTPLAALLSIVLLKPEERNKGDDKDLSTGATLAIFGKPIPFVKFQRKPSRKFSVVKRMMSKL